MLLVLIMTVTLTACGGSGDKETVDNGGTNQSEPVAPADNGGEEKKDDNGGDNSGTVQPENEYQAAVLATKTGKFFSQFADGSMYIEYEFDYDGEKYESATASLNGKEWSKTVYAGTVSITIDDGEYMYIIDEESKTIIKTKSYVDQIDIAVDTNELDPDKMTTGSKTINGKDYYTETWDMDGDKIVMCFDGDELAYEAAVLDGEEMLIKIVSYSKNVDSKLFTIPDDYEVYEY